MEKKQSYLFVGVILVLLTCLIGTLAFGSLSRASDAKELENLQKEMKALEQQMKRNQSAADAARSDLKVKEKEIDELKDKVTQLESGLNLAQSEAKAQKERADELEQALRSAQSLKTAYLTFDDGPSPNTLKVLKILKEQSVPATFFVMNTRYPQYMKNIVDEGHAIAMHTFTHDFSKIYRSVDAFFEDLHKIEALIKEQTGHAPKIMRFAGGSSNMVSKDYSKGIMTQLTKEVQNKGYRYFDWNVDSGDASGNGVSAKKLVENIKNGVRGKDTVCILMHDTAAKNTTVDALPEIIKYLKSQNYHFSSLNVTSPIFHHGINN